jgi:MFS family permease
VVIDLLGFGLVLPLLPRIGENFIEPVLSVPAEAAAPRPEVAEAPPPLGPSVPVWIAFQFALFVAVLGFSFLTPSIQALISKRTDPSRQGEVLGVNQSASALARILGPVIGTVLLKVGPLPFWPYAVAAGLLLLLFVPATRIRAEV